MLQARLQAGAVEVRRRMRNAPHSSPAHVGPTPGGHDQDGDITDYLFASREDQ